MWMLLERVRFTLDGLECDKIGVGYEAFNTQPNFCSSPDWSCLHNQLWNFHEADMNRINQHQLPLYGLEGRFERSNQHSVYIFQLLFVFRISHKIYTLSANGIFLQNAGPHSFSIGVT